MSALAALVLGLALAAGSSDMGIREVKAAHEQQLLEMDGVVSVGIGLAEDGAQAIIVGIARDDDSLRRELPESLEGYRVVVQHVGKIHTQ